MRTLVRRYPDSFWPWLALGVALLWTGVAWADTPRPFPSRTLSLLGDGEPAAARLTLDGPDEPVALTPLTPFAPEPGAPWSDLDAARAHRASVLPGRLWDQPTPVRWSAGSLHGPVLLAPEDSALVTPALLVASNWWLAYRYRTTYDISTLFPFFTVGLALNRDLL